MKTSCEHFFIIEQTKNYNTIFKCCACSKAEPLEAIKDYESHKCNCKNSTTNTWYVDENNFVYCLSCNKRVNY